MASLQPLAVPAAGLVVSTNRGMVIRRLALVAFLAVLALPFHAQATTVTAGWSWVPPTTGVGVVGDSLVWQAEHGSTSATDPYYQRHYLIDELGKQGHASRVAARSGADTRSLSMWGNWATAPLVIVMALGTNDLYYKLPPAISQANVRNYLARWPNACVVYVGVKPSPPRGIEPTAWNTWLATEAQARGGVYVDWATLSAPHPEWFTADQLHMTAAGQAGYRRAIVEGVGRCP